MAFIIILAILILIVLAILAREAWLFVSWRSRLSYHRFVLRMTTGAVLFLLLAAILIGIAILHLDKAAGHPVLFLCWWGGCAVLAFVLVILALLEMREVTKEVLRHESQLWRDVAEDLAKKKRS
jgi:hypothetical protein